MRLGESKSGSQTERKKILGIFKTGSKRSNEFAMKNRGSPVLLLAYNSFKQFTSPRFKSGAVAVCCNGEKFEGCWLQIMK